MIHKMEFNKIKNKNAIEKANKKPTVDSLGGKMANLCKDWSRKKIQVSVIIHEKSNVTIVKTKVLEIVR